MVVSSCSAMPNQLLGSYHSQIPKSVSTLHWKATNVQVQDTYASIVQYGMYHEQLIVEESLLPYFDL
ncbi:hypothetical protein T05_350 [Trichinella murrelli]|uniref:Uncharacterized protein n=1 Tax=Trichinella murrelli TaxID=144512 RepID=A0A0V0T8L7_9BILA|nr:hypothetical protein T05_350 [Trichinella murrelli]